ncbi:MAG: calcium-binding protein, partial [Alteraurantiacibacter sp.]
DTIVEYAGDGIDTVFASASFTLSDNLENLYLLAGATTGIGNGQANYIQANDLTGSSLFGMGGDDEIFASKQSDSVEGGDGNDLIYGFSGFDIIYGGDGIDRIYGGGNADTIYGDAGNDELYGNNGADIIYGGDGGDLLRGQLGNDTLYGGAGIDQIFGNDGRDIIIGGADRDIMIGGRGSDVFVFFDGDTSANPFDADVIRDFSRGDGDQIDLSGMDAIFGGEDDAFSFVGTADFSGTAGELRYEIVNGSTFIYGDTDGDGVGDFAVELGVQLNLIADDFIL